MAQNAEKDVWRPSSDASGALVNTLAEAKVTVVIGQMDVIESNRAEHRRMQSNATRTLLLACLESQFPSSPHPPWKISESHLGRPTVSGPVVMEVSLSHRKSWVAAAFSASNHVGVDVESTQTRLAPQSWELFLHPHEIDWLSGKETPATDLLALSLWCRKEAWLKASHSVELVAMNQIQFAPSGELLKVNGDKYDAGWQFRLWSVGSEALLALAFKSKLG